MHEEDRPVSPAESDEQDQRHPEEHDRTAQPVDLEEAPRLQFPVIGIGGSAGGLEAFIEFFKVMPADSGMAFIVVQHLPPDRESMIADILSKHTAMPVTQIKDNEKVEPDHVYIIRPGRSLTIRHGHLHFGESVQKAGQRHPIDIFFKSLAEEQRERAVCIIMSGMGSNGTSGAIAVKAVGGVALAQEPESAKYTSMPEALIKAGYADLILRPEEMPRVLLGYAQHPYARERAAAADQFATRSRHALGEIISILRSRTRQDFSGYRKPTVLRRIQRRMGLQQVQELDDYAQILRRNNAEATSLADDLVIHVSGFFRDAQAWESLRRQVVQPLIAEREEDSSIRAWITACSSGEEAYTLCMVLIEEMERANKSLDIKVFATDIADRALNQARAGIYPQGIEGEIPEARLKRFFVADDSTYRVTRQLREMVIFGPQNILQDPPFSRLDICTCRNLLIYLEPEVQKRVMSLLHFGIREGGALFLGHSETVSGLEHLFEPLDKRWRIYRRLGASRSALGGGLPQAIPQRVSPRPGPAPIPRASIAHVAQKALVDRFTPAAVVVTRGLQIVYYHGDTSPFLVQPSGEPTNDLLAMAHENVRAAVRVAVHKAISDNTNFSVRDGFLDTPDGRVRIQVSASPVTFQGAQGGILVAFERLPEDAQPASHDAGQTTAETHQSIEELHTVRNELQTTVEELQTANEELQASNEEMTSVNEEFQATNEELETSKEELQSLNEELNTVNSQFQAKVEELEAMTQHLSSLLSSTNIAVLFLDRNFNIRRFTPAMRELIDLLPTDVGRPLSDLAVKFKDPELMSDAQEVLDKLVPIDREILSGAGAWFMRRALPYRTVDNRIDGVVITFVNITRSRLAEAGQQQADERYKLLVQGVREFAIFMLDPAGTVTIWNVGAERVLGFSEQEAIGRNGRFIYTAEDQANGDPERELERAAESGYSLNERWHVRKGGERFWGSGIVTAVRNEDGSLRAFVKVMRDNTDRKIAEEHLEQAHRAAEAANKAKDEFLAVVSHELRTPLGVILLWSKMLRSAKLDPQCLQGVMAIESSAEAQKQLIEDLLDTSRIASGVLRLNLRETDLQPVISGAVQAIRTTATAKGLKLIEDYPKDIGVVMADADRLQQVVWNLLSNAVKFTPSGGHVEVKLVRIGNTVEIRVSDNGNGVSPDFLPRMFDRFKQAEGMISRSAGGLGLGLAIAKDLVELHGGKIEAASAGLDKGSTFTVTLPLPRMRKNRRDAALRSVAAPPAQDATPLKGARILLVEDNEASAAALNVLLTSAGAEIHTANSGATGLDLFRLIKPTIVISDIAMPEMDGYVFIEKLRAMEREHAQDNHPVPAVAVSAFTREEDRSKAITSGFDDHISKPVDTDKLIRTLTQLMAAL